MKNRIISLLLILTLVLSLVSCDIFTPDKPDNGDDLNSGNTNQGGDGSDIKDPDDDTPAVSGDEKIINVYLIAGQSNAVGYGMDTNNSIANSDPRFVKGFENVLYYGSQERWNGQNLGNGFKPVTLGMGVASDRSGAEIGIASAIADNGEMNAIIKCAWGATHLYPDANYDISLKQGTWTSPSYIKNNNVDLSKNELIGNMYSRFETTLVDALRLLIEDGYTPVIKGVWWMQGEAEMFTLEMASKYRELYKTLINDVRNTLSRESGYDCSNVPFICGLPKWNTNNSSEPVYQGMVRTAMKTVAGELANVGYVDCMPLNQHDDWHFDAKGQLYLGEQFVEMLGEFEANDETAFGERVSIDKDVRPLLGEMGLEFSANLSSYNSKSGNQYGFIVAPTALLDENSIFGDYINLLDEKGVEYKNLPAEVKLEKIDEQYSDIYFSCKITEISYEDLNTSFTAIAYVKNEYGTYSYSSRFVCDSLARLCSEELYKEGADTAALLKIVNAGVNSANGVPAENRDDENSLELIVDDSITISFSEVMSEHKLEVGKSVDVDYLVKFTSEDPSVATIDDDGYIRANKVGETSILIECAGKEKRVSVTVAPFSIDGVMLDCIISEGEYVGDVITADNGVISAKTVGMVKNGNFYIAFEVVHGEWSERDSTWWRNDNVEFRLNGESYTVVFYEGEPTYSNNITYGASKTEEVDGKLVTTIELCVEDVPETNQLMLCANGNNFGWLAIVHHNVCNTGFVNSDGIIVAKPISLANGLTLDGVFDESIYTESVKSNVISANGNGANVSIIGTLTDGGVVFGVTINHTKSPYVTVVNNGDWYTFMNIEFHFNGNSGEADQFMFFANNRQKVKGNAFSYSKVTETADGYTSAIEIFIPYESIGVRAGIESIDFTARGWFESGWCDLLNGSWNATHKVTGEGLIKK